MHCIPPCWNSTLHYCPANTKTLAKPCFPGGMCSQGQIPRTPTWQSLRLWPSWCELSLWAISQTTEIAQGTHWLQAYPLVQMMAKVSEDSLRGSSKQSALLATAGGSCAICPPAITAVSSTPVVFGTRSHRVAVVGSLVEAEEYLIGSPMSQWEADNSQNCGFHVCWKSLIILYVMLQWSLLRTSTGENQRSCTPDA